MNVYKITDIKTPYSGGMALVAANDEKEAINIVTVYTSYDFAHERDVFEATILENISCNADEPYLITEEWYYE